MENNLIEDAWWFENKQKDKEILQPSWFTPRTHFSLFFEYEKNIFPIHIRIRALKNGNYLFSADYSVRDLRNDSPDYEILQKENKFLFTGFADGIYGLPEKLKIEIDFPKQTCKRDIPLSYANISGKIIDFEGNAFAAPVVFQRKLFGGKTPSVGVWSNRDGEYSVTVAKGKYSSIYVDDNSYGISTLENWSWNMFVDDDETYDFKIGNGEVYNLIVEECNKDLLELSFRPMVLPCIKKEERLITINNEEYTLLDIQPDIEINDVTIYFDNKIVPIISIDKDYDKFSDNNNKIALILYKLKVRNPGVTKEKTSVIVEYRTTGRYKACSQGRTHFLCKK